MAPESAAAEEASAAAAPSAATKARYRTEPVAGPRGRLGALVGSTVGKKVVMAVTGIVLWGFVLAHMIGNLKVLQGAESMNGYAEWIREVAYPVLPNEGALWIFRAVLLVAVLLHVWAAWSLYRTSASAREVPYRNQEHISFSYASKTMRWGGVIILLFVIYHILHFTTGQAHRDFVAGDVYRNFLVAFQNPWVLGAYLLAQAALGLHLYHGIWSLMQTLGLNHPRYNRYRRPVAAGFAWLIFIGFMTPPLLVFAGVIS